MLPESGIVFYDPKPYISHTVGSWGARRSVEGQSDHPPREALWKLETTHSPPMNFWSLSP